MMRVRVAASARRRAVAADDGGQSSVELALVLPFALLLLLAVVQVGVIVHDQVMVTHAAREAVRASAVSADPSAATGAADAGGGLDPRRLVVTGDGRGPPPARVHVHLEYTCVTDVPVIGVLVPDVHLTADATMQAES